MDYEKATKNRRTVISTFGDFPEIRLHRREPLCRRSNLPADHQSVTLP